MTNIIPKAAIDAAAKAIAVCGDAGPSKPFPSDEAMVEAAILAALPYMGEPVAWRVTDCEGVERLFTKKPAASDEDASEYELRFDPLFAAPPVDPVKEQTDKEDDSPLGVLAETMNNLHAHGVIDDATAARFAMVEEPVEGSVWQHRSGRLYTVLFLTNEQNGKPAYPRTVVYQGENGKRWSGPLHDWHRRMTLCEAGKAAEKARRAKR